MQTTEAKYGWLHSSQAYVSLKNETDKVVVFERAGLLWVFNFHPSKSFADYRVGVEQSGTYRIVLDSDDKEFGGFGRNDRGTRFFSTPYPWNGRSNFLHVYIPTRSAIVSHLLKARPSFKLMDNLGVCSRINDIALICPLDLCMVFIRGLNSSYLVI